MKARVADRFAALVDREYKTLQRVQDYAARLGVSSGHLNVVCNRDLGQSASALIHQRLLLEAKRLLRFNRYFPRLTNWLIARKVKKLYAK